MGIVTRAELRERIRQRANMENSQFVKDPELNGYINDSIARLYDLIINHRGEQYFENSQDITIVRGTVSYDLPVDFYKVVTVEDSGGYPIDTFNRRDLLHKTNILRYNISNNQLKINRSDYSGVIKLWYIPLAPVLDDDADTTDFYNGWDRFVIVDSAIVCLNKEESDTSQLERELMTLERRIQNSSEKNDHQPSRIVDTVGRFYHGDREIYQN